MLKSYKIYTCTNGSLGLHLSRAPWDPYPWVSSIQKDSTSYQAGLRTGDCLLELNGQDVLGMKITEIAALLKNHWLNESSNYVTAVIWRNKCNSNAGNSENSTTGCNENFNNNGDDDGDGDDEDEENNAHNINQQSLQKFATCLQHIAQLLECPVCLEVIKPPGWQCCNGHVLCNNCRSRSEKCPVCRVPLGPRGRCLLSDKLFTLLADSFPCDGVRSNKNSPKDRRKCSTEFHNQPKMAIIQKQQQEKCEQQAARKAKDFLFTSLRQRRRKISSCKANQDDNTTTAVHSAGATNAENNKHHSSMQKQAIYNISAAVKRANSNRKSPPDCNSEAASIVEQQPEDITPASLRYNEVQKQQECHCITCFKSNGVAIVNNLTTLTATANTTTSVVQNKYILRIPSQGQLENIVKQKNYKTYQCPTGKLCCLKMNVAMSAQATCTSRTATIGNNESTTVRNTNSNIHFRVPVVTKNNLSTTTTTTTDEAVKQTALMAVHQPKKQHQVNSYSSGSFHKILENEWDILTHLTEDHQLPVNQYYAEYGQRILVQCLSQQHSVNCLNLKGSDVNDAKVDKFFIACMPLEISSSMAAATSKLAIFVYHLNSFESDCTSTTSPTGGLNDEVSNFETIIENPLTGIKWFGSAHPLTTPWSWIFKKQHYHQHNVLQNQHLDAVSIDEEKAVSGSGSGSGSDDAFVFIVKRKLEMRIN